MIELIMFLLLIVTIWTVGYISQQQHDDIKEEIKKLNEIEKSLKEKYPNLREKGD